MGEDERSTTKRRRMSKLYKGKERDYVCIKFQYWAV